MSTFVEECRREWRRLSVPETVAAEMAEELAADLAEAQADGISPGEFLGEDDPRRFAAAWASERGLVSDQSPGRRHKRRWLIAAGGLAALLAASILIPMMLGSASGTVPTGSAVTAGLCPSAPIPHVLQSCRSKSSPWTVSFRYDPKAAGCKLVFSHGRSTAPAWTIHGGCTSLTWLPQGLGSRNQPQILIFSRQYPLVNSADPATHKVTMLAQLSDFQVSPNGEWIAGLGPGDPRVDPVANTVYVVSIPSRKCLAVPGQSTDIAGFTEDSENVIVSQPYGLRQFAISSLGSSCPGGSMGIIPTNG